MLLLSMKFRFLTESRHVDGVVPGNADTDEQPQQMSRFLI